MAVELATAYVSVVPSTKGIAGQLRNEFGKPLEQQGEKSGKGLASAFGGYVVKGLKLAGGAGIAAFGAALVKGFGRLRTIDDARFKLQGLGHDAETVETIMDNAMESVVGTAFGFGDAASIAASIVAAGIPPGRELERTLKLVGDAATIAGTDLGDMGSIFNQVAAGNRLTMEELNRLGDRGIPIIQWLAEELGIAAVDVRKFVTDGKVDFETFQAAIENNIGGAALTAGESFRGSFANMGAALGRFGAAILGPAFSAAPRVFAAITAGIDSLTGVVGPFIERLTGGGGLEGGMSRVGEAAGRLAEWLRGALGSAVEWLRGVWDSLQPRFASIGESFAGIAATLAPVVQWIGERLPGALQTLWSIAQPIIRFLATMIGDTLRMAIDGVVQAFQGAVSIISGVLDVFAGLFTGDWSRLWEGVKQIGVGIWNAIIGLVKVWLAVGVLKVIGSAFKLITGLFRASWTAIRGLFTGGMNGARSVVQSGMNAIRSLFNAGMRFVESLIRTVWNAIRGAFSAGINFARSLVQSGMSAVRTAVSNAMTAARTAVSNAWTAIRTAISTGISNVVSLVRSLPGRIRSAVGNLANTLRSAGADLIRGLIGGITSMIGRAVEAVTNVIGNVVSGAKRALGISSPSKVFAGIGQDVGRGLLVGLGTMAGPVSGQLQSMMSPRVPGIRVPAAAIRGGDGASLGGPAIHVYIDGREVAAATETRIGRNLGHSARAS